MKQPKMTRSEVIKVLNDERNYQEKKWGTIDTYQHSAGRWADIATRYLNRVYSSTPESMENIRKAAAVLIAAAEQHGIPERQKNETPKNTN